MKRIYVSLGILFVTFNLFAQAPQKFNYQAVARDASGNLLKNKPITLRLNILEGSSTGTMVYSERHSVATNDYGLFTVSVGNGILLSGSFSAITWGSNNQFLKVEMDPSGGTNYFTMGIVELVSVPYALWTEKAMSAQTAATATNMTLNDLQDVNTSSPTTGQVLKWNGTQWVPDSVSTGTGSDNWGSQTAVTNAALSGNGTSGNPLDIARQGATSGQVLKWNGAAWVPGNDSIGNDNWGTQVAKTDATLSGQGTTGNELKIAQQGATSGQTLKWNGTTWTPSADNNTTYTAGTAINISGTTISNTGDTDASNDITNTTSAGGDLNGTYPNPTVDGIQGHSIAANAPSIGQVLKYDGSQWAPASDNGINYSAGAGINISGSTISNTVVALTDMNDVTTTGASTGQVLKFNGTEWVPGTDNTSSSSGGVNVTPRLSGDGTAGTPLDIAQQGATSGQVLKWNGTSWVPATDNGTSYTAGTGISIVGATISNTGDTNANDDVLTTSTAGGDVSGTFSNLQIVSGSVGTAEIADGSIQSADIGAGIIPTSLPPSGTAGGDLNGTYPNPTVDGLQGIGISSTAPASGQVLKYNGTQWAAGADNNTAYTAGIGISISGNVITNTGDTNASDDHTGTGTANYIPKWTGATSLSNSVIYDNGTSVGIGTTSPAGNLDVYTNGSYFGLCVSALNSATIGSSLFFNAATRAWAIYASNTGATAGADKLVFRDYSISADRMVIDNSGNLGLGTTAPVGRLHVKGDNDISQLIIDAFKPQSNSNPLILLRDSLGINLLGITSDVPANTFVGLSAGSSNTFVNDTMGNANTFIGSLAGFSNTTGYFNVALGREALYTNAASSENTAIGGRSLYNNTTGDANTAVGRSALYSNLGGNSNTAFGVRALYSNRGGDANTAFGRSALYFNTSGNDNTAFGRSALYSNISGSSNIGFGIRALYSNTIASYVVGIGDSALFNNGLNTTFTTQGTANTAVGSKSLFSNTSGSNNTAIGKNTLYLSSTSSGNTAIGYTAGDSYANGSNNTFIGISADASAAGLTNSTAIGNGATVSASNNMVFGNSSVTGWGFGTTPSIYAIRIGIGATNGNGAYLTVGGVWTDISERSKKDNIAKLDAEQTLENINQLEITKWKYAGTQDEYHIGPMADDFHRLFNVGDGHSISAMDKTGVLFLGMQALSEENKDLKAELAQQQERINALEKNLREFHSKQQ